MGAKEGLKKCKKNKYQSVTYVSTPIFQGFLTNIVFRSVALIKKKLWAILMGYHDGVKYLELI